MDTWEKLEAEATAGPWRECTASGRRCACGIVWAPDGESVVRLNGGVEDIPTQPSKADASLVTFLRNRSPQLRAVVEAARNRVGYGEEWAVRPEDRALYAALRALDEVT